MKWTEGGIGDGAGALEVYEMIIIKGRKEWRMTDGLIYIIMIEAFLLIPISESQWKDFNNNYFILSKW